MRLRMFGSLCCSVVVASPPSRRVANQVQDHFDGKLHRLKMADEHQDYVIKDGNRGAR
jgi:hypothetical protein